MSNLLFVFDIRMFTHFLEKEVGNVNYIDNAVLPEHSLIFRQTRDEGFAKADYIPADLSSNVMGVVYNLTQRQLKKLKERASEGFDSVLEKVIISIKGKEKSALSLRPNPKSDTLNHTPFSWYVDLMIAGANLQSLSPVYVKSLSKIKTANDPMLGRVREFNNFLKYPEMIEKEFSDAFKRIKRQNKGGTFTIKLPNHVYDGRKLVLKKKKGEFHFQTSTKVIKGLQYNDEFAVSDQTILLERGRRKIYIPGRDFFMNNIQYDDLDQKLLSGTISGFSSVPPIELDGHFCRIMIPVDEIPDIDRHFQYWSFLKDGQLRQGLIKLQIDDNETHLYAIKNDGSKYLVIDSLGILPLRKFQEVCYAILLVYALLRGQFLSGEAHIFMYRDTEMKNIAADYYHKMGEPIFGLPGVFTTNGFTGVDSKALDRDGEGNIDKDELKKINEGMHYFSDEVFSKMCNEVLSTEKILRSLMIMVQNQKATLEIRIPAQYVALEALTATFIKGGNKGLKPITNKKKAGKLVDAMKLALDNFIKEQDFTAEENARLNPLRRKLEHFNSPPNADKLSESFKSINYTISPEEFRIIKMRDNFLHGSTVEEVVEEDYGFKEMFYISLRLHFLLSVLLLKKAGFTGKILNHVKLYSTITEKGANEERFVSL